MNRNLVIVLAGGFLIAVLVALIVQASLGGGAEEAAPTVVKEEPRAKIIVAAKDLAIGSKLTEDNMKWQDWPKNAIFPGAVVRTDSEAPIDLLTGTLKRPIAAGEPIIESAIIKENAPNFVAATLGEGMRAVSIAVNATSMVAGFVGPGDYVDIILTYDNRTTFGANTDIPEMAELIDRNLSRTATETVMQNIKVLAVDQAPVRDEEKGIRVGKTVTLEVDMEGAEKLALMQRFGELSLSLRKLGDNTIYEKKHETVTDARTVKLDDEMFGKVNQMEQESGINANVVRIYNGPQVQQATIGQGN